MNIVLIGYRGTGKSTVAAALAARLGYHWHDADQVLEARAGCSIATIFAEQGEQAFRDLESATIADLVKEERIVLATGGGAILREENRQRLRACGKIVWLTARVETILTRVAGDQATAGRRPNLTTQGGEAEVRQLLQQREPWYRALADAIVATDDRAPEEIVDEIIERLITSKN